MISKELLGEVLGYKVYNYILKDTNIKLNKITTSSLGSEPQIIGYDKGINIYELAFECKKWAYKNCNEIISYTEGAEIYQTQLDEKIKTFYGDTEVEAIFKACQWILDNKESK